MRFLSCGFWAFAVCRNGDFWWRFVLSHVGTKVLSWQFSFFIEQPFVLRHAMFFCLFKD